MKSIIVSNRGQGDITKREDFTPMKLLFYNNLDYIFVPFWSWYIPASIYDNWEVVIFHLTDLPFGRGGSPLQNLISIGYKETVICAIRCVEEIDAGSVYMRYPLDISKGTADEIYNNAGKKIREIMIPYILENKPIAKEQRGKPVYFLKWRCSKSDIIRAIETDYEWINK